MNAGPQPRSVKGFGQVVVVHGGLHPVAGRGWRESPPAFRQQQGDHHFNVPADGVLPLRPWPLSLERRRGSLDPGRGQGG